MPVHIKDINIKEVGPIRDFRMSPGSVNLIYGQNENGKTFLTEFMVQTLFHTGRGAAWDLRDSSTSGKITVTGLEGDEPEQAFKKSTKPKLDQIWTEADDELPRNIARLLVVKGGQLELQNGLSEGVNRSVITDILSSEEILRSIDGKMKENVKNANITQEGITGTSQGEMKKHTALKADLAEITTLVSNADDLCATGDREELKQKKNELAQNIEIQTKAKAHHAYNLDKELSEYKNELSAIPTASISDLDAKVTIYRDTDNELSEKSAELQETETPLDNINWLENCLNVYREVNTVTVTPKKGLLITAGVLLAIMAVTMFIKPFLALIPLVAGIACGWLYIKSLKASNTGSDQRREELSVEFKERFGEELTNEPQIMQLLGDLEKKSIKAEMLNSTIEALKGKRRENTSAINSVLAEIGIEACEAGEWSARISEIKQKRQDIENNISLKSDDIRRIGVNEQAYLTEDPGTEYDPVLLDKLTTELSDTEQEIEDEDQRLINIKEELAREVDCSASESLEDVLAKLIDKRDVMTSEYKNLTAYIIAGKLISDTVEELLETEDELLKDGLQDDNVLSILKEVTGRYDSIELKEDELMVSDSTDDFSVASLSTGAREQVLLALRMGFAARFAGDNSLFLILDDAFQYSDWDRRVKLVDQVFAMAEKGWQIIYLTMDDHLRDLFCDKGQALGDSFVFKELKSV